MSENIDILHKIAAELLEKETISGGDIDVIMNGGELPSRDETPTEPAYVPVEEKKSEDDTGEAKASPESEQDVETKPG